MAVTNSLTRFSDRVEDYVRSRPGYPPEVLEWLTNTYGLSPDQVVADVGSGTGISSKLFLQNGNRVFGVEPNRDMRLAAEHELGRFERFHSIDARAEATTLPDGSVQWVIAAQAFHWFDVEACRCEFRRILTANGKVALLWNDRREDTPFLKQYGELVRDYSTDYQAICHRNAQTDGRIERFFSPGSPRQHLFPNHQDFDFAGLKARLLSSSYMPRDKDPRFDPMMKALEQLFERYAASGKVRFSYDTMLLVGSISS